MFPNELEALLGKAAPKHMSDDIVYACSVDDNTTLEIRHLGEIGFIGRGSFPKVQDTRGVVRLDMYHKLFSLDLLLQRPRKLPATFQPLTVCSVACDLAASETQPMSGCTLISRDGLIDALTSRWKDLPASEFWTRDKYPPSDVEVNGATYTLSDATRLRYGLPPS